MAAPLDYETPKPSPWDEAKAQARRMDGSFGITSRTPLVLEHAESEVARSVAPGKTSGEIPRTVGIGGYASIPWGPIQSGCDADATERGAPHGVEWGI